MKVDLPQPVKGEKEEEGVSETAGASERQSRACALRFLSHPSPLLTRVGGQADDDSALLGPDDDDAGGGGAAGGL